MPIWLKEKLFLKATLRRELAAVGNCAVNELPPRDRSRTSGVQPAAGDAGSAIGAAAVSWFDKADRERHVNGKDFMQGTYLRPRYFSAEIINRLDPFDAVYAEHEDEELFARLAELLDQGKVIGWFQGRLEFGPRALGGRSIIGDPRNSRMQIAMNLKIKYRESFRPFAPSVLAERVSDYFEQVPESPYMLIVAPVREELRRQLTEQETKLFGVEQLKVNRSDLPAITHVDYSARVQTVHEDTNPRTINY